MSKHSNRIANACAVVLILPFAAGMVRAAESAPYSSEKSKSVTPAPEKAVPPPTMDSNGDGRHDAWDRDANGKADAWDHNNDGRPDKFDDDGDGRPDDKAPKADAANTPPVTEKEGDQPRS